MIISCTICKDIYIPHSHVLVTSCGHLYHDICITEWIKNKRTCPQCRTRLNGNPIRVYFNIEEEDVSDPALMQVRIDQLSYKLQTTNIQCKEFEAQLITSKEHEATLRQMVKDLECSVATTKQTIYGLREELKRSLKQLESKRDLEAELDCVTNKLETYEQLELVLKGSIQEVQKALKIYPVTADSVRRLITYVEALKEKNGKADEKYRTLSRDYKKQQEKNKVSLKNEQILRDKLEEVKRMIAEDETKSFNGSSTSRNSQNAALSSVPEDVVEPSASCSNFSPLDVFPVPKKVVDLRKATPRSVHDPFVSYPSKKVALQPAKSSSFHFDGMGGSKKTSLVTPMNRFEKSLMVAAAAKKKPFCSVARAPSTSRPVPSTSRPSVPTTSRATAAPFPTHTIASMFERNKENAHEPMMIDLD